MAEPTEATIKKLFALSGNNCAFPKCQLPIVDGSGVITGEICHIRAKSPSGPRFDSSQSNDDRHSFANLILLCRHHHRIIDLKPDIYTVDALAEMKSAHINLYGRPEAATDLFYAKVLLNDLCVAHMSGNVAINSPGSMVANVINIRNSEKNQRIKPPLPQGSIGADLNYSRYIMYLINRYNEFASKDSARKTKFSYGAISKNIESNFGSAWRYLPIERASEVFEYLQNRINKTRVAKICKGKGYSTFSTYAEFSECEN